ncbi:MAG TPA: S8 family serine peptidase [Chitinophagaceae bacterium]|nr:S8 family serine peptidase [Chitinophagaceae bacterium]
MTPLRAALAFLCFLFSSLAYGQNDGEISLRTGIVSTKSNIRASFIDSFNKTAPRLNNKTAVLLRFEGVPSAQQKNQLAASGIQVHNYIAPGLYSATITGNVNADLFQATKVMSIIQLTPSQKTDRLLAGNKLPAWAMKIPGTIDVNISFPAAFSYQEVSQFLRQKNIDIISDKWAAYGKLSLRLSPKRITELATFPFVGLVEPAEPEIEMYNHKSRQLSRSNILNTSVADGGLGLNGEGVVVGIGDNSAIITQADFSGRLVERTVPNASHGIHVAGTAAGAGIINELYRGFAPKASIINALQVDIVDPLYVQDYNMVVTNNSYGSGFNCDINGAYIFSSSLVDDLALAYPSLLNVYGAGNYAQNTCAPYPAGFGTVTGLWQSAKNTVCVGGTTDSGEIGNFSSRGPTKDGRIKPDIVAMGLQVTSTWPNNIYSFNSGTSMAAPAVTGGLALLYQRYRQMHAGADPRNGLMKALLCNGATDGGNPGPDYTYGFGTMNLLRSIEMLNKQQYFIASSNHNATNTHTITVPAGTAQLKVMLYWNDPSASSLAPKALVNDLDLEVSTPSAGIVLPYVLDHTPANVEKPAVRGADHLNNIEQVVIDNPTAGNYTLRVKGTGIVQHPQQEYFVVYDALPVSVGLTYPIGGEAMVPGESVKLSWDAYGNPGKTFNLQFSADNGASWTDIATNLDPARRIYTWQVPAMVTTAAQVRVVQNETGLASASRPFTIIAMPVVSLSAIQCETYFAIDWTAVPGANYYEVMMLRGNEMKVIDTTSNHYYKITNLSKEETYWVGVRPIINGKAGRRSVAVSRKPNSGTCGGSISDNDLAIDGLLSPVTGRKFTSTALQSDHTVTVRIKNLDNAPVNGFTVSYSVNDRPWISENVPVLLGAGVSYDHSFSTPADLGAVGNYTVRAVVKNNTLDASATNDTLVKAIRSLDNQPLDLTNLFLDNLESAVAHTYTRDTVGLPGIDRYDFETVSKTGQVFTFFNSGYASSGSRSFIMGEIMQRSTPGLHYITGTFNLSGYSVLENNLRIDFMSMNTHFPFPGNDLWVRGADNLPWIKVYTVPTRFTDTFYKRTISIAFADSLAAHGQNVSASFQARWGHSSIHQSLSKRRTYGIDDIRIYQAVHDMQVLSIDTPSAMSCNIAGQVPVRVRLHNSHFSALSNVPIKYSVNNGQWVEEVIASIPAKSNFQYTFNQPMDFLSKGSYKLKVVVVYPSDNFRDNDTVQVDIQNSITVTAFPYLQNFESGTEGWYTSGQNSSWAYGTPASSKIRGAASGARAWKTNLSGNHNSNELSYLYSPCFMLDGMTKPTLSFSMILDIEECQLTPCDGAWVEFTRNGTTWTKMGTVSSGYNWYNTSSPMWSGSAFIIRWEVATHSLPIAPGPIRFRFVFLSSLSGNREGIAIDDVHIYDNTSGIYDSTTMASPATQVVLGNNWLDFKLAGKLLASVHANNQVPGIMNAQVYIHQPEIRSTSTQYYHKRNLTLKAANPIDDSVTVRFYFLDRETDSLIDATGCQTCTKPSSAYQLGVSTYNDHVESNENGTLADNKTGNWSFINSWNVTKVPFDKGYYAEFKVKEFSEIWLSNGGHDLNSHLAIQLIHFTAHRAGDRDALLNWQMGDEKGIARYEVEMARDRPAMQANQFVKIAQTQAQGIIAPNVYSLTDSDPDKFDTVYYRLKIIYGDGRFNYSPVRSVIFDEAVLWKLYPNPSAGRFYLDFSGNINERLVADLFDAKGSLLKTYTRQSTGFMQKLQIDLSNTVYANGVYLLRVNIGGIVKTFKLYKQ